MQTPSAKDAKYGFGRLIDLSRAKPVAVAKHARPVVVVLSVEECQRPKSLDAPGGGTLTGGTPLSGIGLAGP